MKNILVLVLSLAMILSLCACGGSSGTANSNPASSESSNTQQKNDDPMQEVPVDSTGHLTYEDLSETENFWLWLDEGGTIQLQIDYPSGFLFDSHGNGMGSDTTRAFSIVMVHSEKPMPDTSLEDAFYALLNGEGGFHSILRMVNKATYDEVTPETELVTLDCGKEAIRFSGTQHMDDYGTIADCPIWGYCTLLDNIPVIVCYVVFDEVNLAEGLAAGQKAYHSTDEMAHYAEEMINTVRLVEE